MPGWTRASTMPEPAREQAERSVLRELLAFAGRTPLSAAGAIVGQDRVVTGVRTMGGEDMAFFLARVPGAFAFVGSAPPGKPGAPHHSPTFDIDEEALVIGAELLSSTVVRYLETGA